MYQIATSILAQGSYSNFKLLKPKELKDADLTGVYWSFSNKLTGEEIGLAGIEFSGIELPAGTKLKSLFKGSLDSIENDCKGELASYSKDFTSLGNNSRLLSARCLSPGENFNFSMVGSIVNNKALTITEITYFFENTNDLDQTRGNKQVMQNLSHAINFLSN